MLKAEELRIGNHIQGQVQVNGPMELFIVTGIEQEFGRLKMSGFFPKFRESTQIRCLMHGMEVVPITSQLLIDYGFETTPGLYGMYYQICIGDSECKNLAVAWYAEDEKYISALKYDFVGYHHHVNITPNIKSLHQLQNLYFALTGKELVNKTFKD